MSCKVVDSKPDLTNPGHVIANYLISTTADLTSMPATASPGSMAYTADYMNIYQLALDGTWTKVGG